MTVPAIWDNLEALAKLEARRGQKKEPTFTYDCHNAHCRGDRVYCSIGYRLSIKAKDGTMGLIGVLRGVTSGQCKKCLDFEGDE